jgi:hypothetical protein
LTSRTPSRTVSEPAKHVFFSSVGAGAACLVVGAVGTSFMPEGVVAGEEAGEEAGDEAGDEAGEEAMVGVGVKGAGVTRVGVGVGALEGARDGLRLGIIDDAGLGGAEPAVSVGLGGAVADKSWEGGALEDGSGGVVADGKGVLFGGEIITIVGTLKGTTAFDGTTLGGAVTDDTLGGAVADDTLGGAVADDTIGGVVGGALNGSGIGVGG